MEQDSFWNHFKDALLTIQEYKIEFLWQTKKLQALH